MAECDYAGKSTTNQYWLLSGCSLTSGDNDLTWHPHPTEFVPYSDVKVQGTGDLSGLGYTVFKWTSGGGILSAQQWAHLMGFFSGDEPSVDVCVRTRTDKWSVNAFGEFEYEYCWFTAKMHRPRAEPYPNYRFRNIEILFSHAVRL